MTSDDDRCHAIPVFGEGNENQSARLMEVSLIRVYLTYDFKTSFFFLSYNRYVLSLHFTSSSLLSTSLPCLHKVQLSFSIPGFGWYCS